MADRTYDLKEQRAAALKAVIDVFDGDSDLAEAWLDQPIKALDDKKPADYLNSVERIRTLRGVIKRLEHGFP